MKILLLLLAISTQSFAFDIKGETLSIGPGLFVSGQHRVESKIDHHSTDTAFTAFPYIYYRNKGLEVNGLEAKYKFKLNTDLEIGPIVKWTGDFYEGPGVAERRLSPFAGVYAKYHSLNFHYIRGLTNEVQGSIAELSFRKSFKVTNSWYADFSIGAEYFDDKYVSYYFGVKPSEAGFFPTYTADAGLNGVATIGSYFSLPYNLAFYISLGHKVLSNEVSNSPTVDRDNYLFSTAFLSYRFY